MAGGDSAAETEQTGQAEEEKAAEEESAVSEQIYYAMDQSLIVNFPKNPVASLIQVSVTLLVKDAETVEALKKHEPMIRNNLLMKISAKGASKLQSREGKEELRSEMLDEVNQVMELMTKKNNVENIFFTAFVMQ